MGRIDDLKTELDTDSLVRGYAGMDDAAAAADLNTVQRERNLASLTASQVLNAVDKTEFNALATDADRQRVWDILHIGEINGWSGHVDMSTSPAAAITASRIRRGCTLNANNGADTITGAATKLGGIIQPGGLTVTEDIASLL